MRAKTGKSLNLAQNYIQWITFLYSRKAEEINLEAF
jgi:hypothetical protein